MLEREEYIEQAFLFSTLRTRMQQNMATQDVLDAIREELLSTTKLPLAVDFLASELRLTGVFAPAMARLAHYFTPFQTFVVEAAESDRGRFDFLVALEILELEARYRSEGASPQGIFLYQFECLARNRMGYDHGLQAIGRDPIFGADWRAWIELLRKQIGLVDFADLLFLRSEHYTQQRIRQGLARDVEPEPMLFGEKEGKIALANRQKDPLLLFSALQRQLGYPAVPRTKPVDETKQLLPALLKKMNQVEARLKLLEEEQRGGIDITKFYSPDKLPPPIDDLGM